MLEINFILNKRCILNHLLKKAYGAIEQKNPNKLETKLITFISSHNIRN